MRYSREFFDEYNIRFRVEVKYWGFKKGDPVLMSTSFDVYTDEVDGVVIEKWLSERDRAENVKDVKVVYLTTRENDEMNAKMLKDMGF
jgi:hypothetical protein